MKLLIQRVNHADLENDGPFTIILGESILWFYEEKKVYFTGFSVYSVTYFLWRNYTIFYGIS